MDDSFHGGALIARRLKAHGVSKLFTLSGGHIFPIYDGCRAEGIDIIDVRHEQTAAFAAEGWAKVTRTLGVCALTAGPGITNAMSAIASAQQNDTPMLVLGGRAPALRWGQGSLQELDHVPFIAPLTKSAVTAESTEAIPARVEAAIATALAPRSGPTFVDFPLDFIFGSAPEHLPADAVAPAPADRLGAGEDPGRGIDGGAAEVAAGAGPARGAELEAAARALAAGRRPVIMAGTGLYWGAGEVALGRLAEARGIPVFLNGLGRGCLPADHPLAFSRARARALAEADVAVIVGVPLDFRLGFGAAFAPEATLISVDVAAPVHRPARTPAHTLIGPLGELLDGLAGSAGPGSADPDWVPSLRRIETDARTAEAAQLRDGRAPLHPMRIYGELAGLLDRDAIVIGDGGDFVSFAGRLLDSYAPGCWLDPGPFGCLGTGPGYALAAKLAHPTRQVVLLQGDGAFGFSGMDWDTLVRHGVAVVSIVANNGIWALEKHPMELLYGYSVAADLTPGTRYDEVVAALGGHGETVAEPDGLRAALERALGAGRPALVNVLTDPSVPYPRRANLA
ncbi:acetolactate synthase [Conexibacter sp. DBS9H8]|uniref:acetolactate synthase n=1 Tax=Conexibacter sp. DBS9H8 TaxID=2937801 RepID=UPI00200BC3D4|nr:acetolactate synthase [Conexibacter sp. DBS9H8]